MAAFQIDQQSLYDYLLEARKARDKEKGEARARAIRPILNAIVGQEIAWTPEQCKKCFREIITRYTRGEIKDQLLAVSALGEMKYAAAKSLAASRVMYHKDHGEDVGLKRLETRENDALLAVAKEMKKQTEEAHDTSPLFPIICDSIEYKVIQGLGLEGFFYGVTPEAVNLREELHRVGRISNICETDEHFVGRVAELTTMDRLFREENNYAVFLYGEDGVGKTRLALHYAATRDYKMICFINAWSEATTISSILDFLDKAGVSCEKKELEAIRQVFLDFFNANQGWIIIFDHVQIVTTGEMAQLLSYFPEQKGHIIVTGVFERIFGDLKAQDMRVGYMSTEKNGDSYKLLMEVLGKDRLPEDASHLIHVSRGHPYFLTVAGKMIREIPWLDFKTLTNIVQEFGIDDRDMCSTILRVALDYIRMQSISLKDNIIARAVLDLVCLFSDYFHQAIDLELLSKSFQMLPDDLTGMLVKEQSRKEIERYFTLLGFYEAKPGYFVLPLLRGVVWSFQPSPEYIHSLYLKTVDRIEDTLRAAHDSSFIKDFGVLVGRVLPYIDASSLHAIKDLAGDQYPLIKKYGTISQLFVNGD